MIYVRGDKTPGAWDAFIKAMNSGAEVEIDAAMYDYCLEVLPPIFMNRLVPFPDPKTPMRYDFGFAEGAEPVTVFWRAGHGTETRHYCRQTAIMNPYA